MLRTTWTLALCFLFAGLFTEALAQAPKPAAKAAPAKPVAVSHELEDRADCLMCHASGAMEGVPAAPASHKGRANETCLWCHGPGAAMQKVVPAAVPHDIAGQEACLTCHAPGAMEGLPVTPADHKGRTDKYCLLCHKVAGP